MKVRSALCLLLALLLTVLCCPFTASAAAHPDIPRGDADLDGEITPVDAAVIQRTLAALPVDSFNELTANVDGGDIDITDATVIQRYLSEIDCPPEYDLGLTALIWDGDKYITVEEDYQSFLDELVEENDFSGVVFVTRYGRLLCQSVTGVTDPDDDTPITLDTRFPIGSVSKQFCAAAVLILQQQGKLSVTDTLDKYFPTYAEGKDITVDQLLSMRSGIPNFLNEAYIQFPGMDPPEDAEPDDLVIKPVSAVENRAAIRDWLFRQELDFTPGTYFDYSNSNYSLLSMIVEQVSGMPYEQFVKDNIFTPLGMDRSGFYEELADEPDFARMCAGSPLYSPDFPGLLSGAGDIASTAADMDKWLTSLRTGTLLSRESLDAMSANHSPRQASYGYGINTYEDGTLFHNGSVDCYYAYDYTDTTCGYNFFAVTNAGDLRRNKISYDSNLNIDDFSGEIIDYTLDI